MDMMVVQAGKQSAAGGIDYRFAGFGEQIADRGDPFARNSQIGPAVAENLGMADQHDTVVGR